MNEKILTFKQKQTLKKVQPLIKKHRFILVGGTAVALLLGHRRSVDFDFITAEMFLRHFSIKILPGIN